ncbi:hypothetical protein ACFLXQ_01945 [Chloroflexota bacterium]
MGHTDFLDQSRDYSLKTLDRYWPGQTEIILKLPIPVVPSPQPESLPPRTQWVNLPLWVSDIGVTGNILVPNQFIVPGKIPAWNRTDWLSVIFWYLNGIAEQAFEKKIGPIHSYSIHLRGWDHRLWQWV